MQRRNFLQQSVLAAGAALLTATNVSANKNAKNIHKRRAEKTFNLNYGFHDGMFKNSGGADFLDQIKFAYDMGFRSIEDNGMPKRTPEMQKKIGDTLAKLGMAIVFN